MLGVDALQALFLALDPLLAFRKFSAFSALDPASQQAADFVALEDWLNDGVPLTASVAEECLLGWYGQNSPARGAWRVGERVVDPRQWQGQALLAIPTGDRIVPPASAEALAMAMPAARVLKPRAGHIGMVVSRQAEAALWRPLADWLRQTK
jgi:poly(3-hydroxyalkanoate) synthetase